MTNGTNDAHALWDKEMNFAYRTIMASLSSDEQQALRTAPQQWIMYRNAEFKAIDAIYESKDGTMFRPMRAADPLQIVKARAMQLLANRNLRGE